MNFLFQLTFLFCLLFIYNTLAEEKPNDEKLDSAPENVDRIVLEKSKSYNRRISTEEPSFFSKLKSWIFPFGGTSPPAQVVDSIPAAGRQAYPVYGPPASQSHRPDCNPCNKEPWIPISTNYGQNTIIGFVPPATLEQPHSNLEFLQAPVNGQYGAPNLNNNYGPPKEQYFSQNNINANYDVQTDLEKLNQNLSPPSTVEILSTPPINYGPPPQVQNHNPPANINYGLPSQIPIQNHNPPPNINYGPPPQVSIQNHNPLPNINYGPPLPQPADLNSNFVLSADVTPPKIFENLPPVYGPPTYTPPTKLIPQAPPKINYGPPKAEDQISLIPPSGNYLSQRPGKSYGSQHRRPNSHGPLNYPPIPKDYVSPPSFKRGLPKHLPAPPRFIQKPIVKARPPLQQYGPPFFVPDMKPPLANSFITNYGVPINQYSTIPPEQYGPPQENIIPTVQILPSAEPSDSYGAPVTGIDVDYGLSSQISGKEYLPPLNSGVNVGPPISLPVFDDILEAPKEPIAFPNLYQLPLTPIHSAKDFHQNLFHVDVGGEYQESRQREVYNGNQVTYDNQNKGFLSGNQIININQNQREVPTVEVQSSQQIYSAHTGTNTNNANANVQSQDVRGSAANDLLTSSNQREVVKDVQIVQSIPVANFLSSIEHPINIIQSPVVEVGADIHNANHEIEKPKNYGQSVNKLSENPIIVQSSNFDSHPSASAQNVTYQSSLRSNDNFVPTELSNEVTETIPNPEAINQFLQSEDNSVIIQKAISKNVTQKLNPSQFTPPPLDYTSWSPSINFISSSMVPPPPGDTHWITSLNQAGEILTTTTKKPKQIQIVIPYTNYGKTNGKSEILKGKKTTPYDYVGPKLSLYTQPPTSESVWLKYTEDYNTEESNKFTSTVYPDNPKSVINIKDLLKKEEDKRILQNLPPFDVISLQKNIDGWTEQEYSRKLNRGLADFPRSSTPSFFVPSKHIPTSYLSTSSYNVTHSTTAKYTRDFYDHEPAGSNKKESKLSGNDDFENNFIITEATTLPSTTEEYGTTEYPIGQTETREETTINPSWSNQQTLFSGLDKEKIYVVTPQPLTRITTTPSTISFSHPPRVGGQSAAEIKDGFNEGLRLIFSEWPHLINNLETTTTTQRPTSAHPLFGLMDLSSYIPPPNSTIQTYAGHSKVITIVTPISFVSRNIGDASKEKNHSIASTEPSSKS